MLQLLRTFDEFTTVWSKTFTDINLFNSQIHFYKPCGNFITIRQTSSIDILAASKIHAKYVAFVVRLRIS